MSIFPELDCNNDADAALIFAFPLIVIEPAPFCLIARLLDELIFALPFTVKLPVV